MNRDTGPRAANTKMNKMSLRKLQYMGEGKLKQRECQYNMATAADVVCTRSDN